MESQNNNHNNILPKFLFTISLSLILVTNAVQAARYSIYPVFSPSSQPTPASPSEPVISYKQYFPSKGQPGSKTEPPPTGPTQDSQGIGLPGIGLGPINPNPEIEKICDLTDYPPLCMAAVLPHLHGQITVETVFSGAVQASNEFAKYCVGVAKQIAANPVYPPAVKSVFEDCKDGYETMVDNFVETIDASQKHDMGTMKSMLSAVLTFAGDCEDELDEMGIQSPLKDYAVKLKNMTSNCLAITDIMEGKPPQHV